MLKRNQLGPILAAISILAAACSTGQGVQRSVKVKREQISVPGGTYSDISAPELHAMLENKDFVFVNVHIPYEGEIANTNLSIPFNQIDQNLDQLPQDKNAQIVLYCRSGRMSGIAAETLVGLGYTNIWNLKGGMVAWEEAGFPLERK
jgi:rhodanese-related sulfurtransferase